MKLNLSFTDNDKIITRLIDNENTIFLNNYCHDMKIKLNNLQKNKFFELYYYIIFP